MDEGLRAGMEARGLIPARGTVEEEIDRMGGFEGLGRRVDGELAGLREQVRTLTDARRREGNDPELELELLAARTALERVEAAETIDDARGIAARALVTLIAEVSPDPGLSIRHGAFARVGALGDYPVVRFDG